MNNAVFRATVEPQNLLGPLETLYTGILCLRLEQSQTSGLGPSSAFQQYCQPTVADFKVPHPSSKKGQLSGLGFKKENLTSNMFPIVNTNFRKTSTAETP